LLESIAVREGPDAGAEGFMIASPLEAAGIPIAWSPCSPGENPTGTRGRYSSDYTLYVPEMQLEEARRVLRDADSPYAGELPSA
jgi:hypothetical protein